MDTQVNYKEELSNAMFHSKGYGIVIADTTGKWIDCNEIASSLFGYGKEELLHRTNQDIIYSNEEKDKMQLFNDLLSKKIDGCRFEKQLIRKDGSLFWGSLFITPVCNQSGEIIIVSIIIVDVSERKKAEQELHRSREAFKKYFELGTVGMCVTSPEKRWIEVNTRLCQMFGYSKEELQQLTWVELTHPDDLSADVELFNKVLSGERNSYDLDKRFIRKDGSILYTTLSVTCQRNENGTLQHILASLIDITDRKLAEQDYKREKAFMDKLFDSSPEAIFVSDQQDLVAHANTKFHELFGFTKEEVVGKKIDNLIATGKYHEEATEITNTVLSGKTIELETVRCRKDGTAIDVSIIATPINIGGHYFGGYGIYRDITDRKRSEKALSDSEEMYRNLVEKIPDGVYKSTQEGKFIEVNPAMVKMLGYNSKEELLAIDIKTQLFSDPSDRKSIVLDKKLEEIRVYRFKRKDGSEIWVEDHEFDDVDENGKILIHEGILRDISERMQAEAALKESEEKFRFLAEYSPNMIFINIKGRIVYANHLCEKVIGYTKDELYSSDFNFINLITLKYKELVKESFRIHSDSQENPPYECALITKNKKKLHVLLSTKLIHFDGENAILGVVTDITERKLIEEVLLESEERLRSLYENASVGLYRTTPEGKILLANPALIQTLGFNSFEELAQRNLKQEGFEPDYPRSDFIRQIEREGFIKGLESKWRRNDGTFIYVRESAKAFRDENRKIKYFEGTIEDITVRKLAELQLAKQTEELKELNATKDKFFSIIAHDLKNPFNAILGFSNLLITDFHELDTKEILKYLNNINNSSKQAFTLLENLLLWARSQTGTIDFQPEILDLRDLVLNIIELLENQARKKSISISSCIKDHCPVKADKNMIETILRNLLTNAIKFTPKNGKIVVSITGHNDQVEISVKDTGVGIAKENMEFIFRIERKTTTLGTEKETGSGLGLILCKEFVEKHGGKIWAESELGRGSNFKFTIPTK